MPDDAGEDAMSEDKLAVLEPREDGTTLIRGRGFAVIAQFDWVVLVAAGAVVPDDKLPTARKLLQSMGYRLTAVGGGDDPARRTRRSTPLPLPECATPGCGRPYRRGHTPRASEHCAGCGELLVLTQHDPDDPGCPHCAVRATSNGGTP